MTQDPLFPLPDPPPPEDNSVKTCERCGAAALVKLGGPDYGCTACGFTAYTPRPRTRPAWQTKRAPGRRRRR